MSALAAWLAALASVAGAALAYLGARRGSRPQQRALTQSARDEWGRRFTTAIEMMTDSDERHILMGQALLGALLDSDLAQADDRRIAVRLLRESVLAQLPRDTLDEIESAEQPGRRAARFAVDEIEFVEDHGTSDTEELR